MYTGKKYGKLTLISEPYKKPGKRKNLVQVKCECGCIAEKQFYSVTMNIIKSCGDCYRKKSNKIPRTSDKGRRLYNSWRIMLTKCHNPDSPVYTRYGAKGIKVCE